jgi:cytoskeleton protein RodZ
MDIGSSLRNARERNELTLAHLATKTKIPVAILHALEANDFDKVPRGIFLRGFLRAYAAEVGLDPNQVVTQFLLENGTAAAAAADTASGDVAALDEEVDDEWIDPNTSAGPGWGYLLVVAALLAAFTGLNRYITSPDENSRADAGAGQALDAVGATTAGGIDAVAAVATTGRKPPAVAGPASSSTAMLRFDLEAEGECWVEAVVDGQRVVYRLMQRGERQTIESHGEIVLRVGDPGALTYRVNGAPGKPLGRAGIPVTVRFTNQGA